MKIMKLPTYQGDEDHEEGGRGAGELLCEGEDANYVLDPTLLLGGHSVLLHLPCIHINY